MNFENHKDLVDIIKGVHSKLRKAFHLTGNVDEVWKYHIADEDLRKTYSNAMFRLATEIWKQKESRISWTYSTCVDYFQNGGIEKSLLRELKIKQKWSPSQTEKLEIELYAVQWRTFVIFLHNSVYESVPFVLSNWKFCLVYNNVAGRHYLLYLSNQENNYKNISRKLKLLDVGSCYNPFSRFPIFSCVAIDLTPATEDVMQCDFLTVEINNQGNSKSNEPYGIIFCEENFDVVVFSLVLEYLPATEQRLKFCVNAWKLLQQNGLLIIITPDSKRLHHNVAMIKSWKKALENIGFIRVKYNKLTHLHCMAFRKVYNSFCNEDVKLISKLLYIPQDFKTYDPIIQSSERTEHENYTVCQQFSELPKENLF